MAVPTFLEEAARAGLCVLYDHHLGLIQIPRIPEWSAVMEDIAGAGVSEDTSFFVAVSASRRDGVGRSGEWPRELVGENDRESDIQLG